MRKSRPGKESLSFSRSTLAILLGALAVVSIAVIVMGSNRSSSSVHASPINQKRYKATKPIVVDKQTGQPRMPNQEEIDQVVSTLSVLAARPEDLPQTQTATGAVVIDLEGGYNGVMLARPNADGTLETRCVFTFEEGAEFLGLVEDNSTE